MEEQNVSELENEIEVPVSALIRVERNRGYGHVPGLQDDELADPHELERQVMIADWGPILALPCKAYSGGIRPVLDEFGHLDWGAFGTVDFSRIRPEFDKARYKADRLAEEQQDAINMLSIMKGHLSEEARTVVVTQIRAGLKDPYLLEDADRQGFARWWLRAQRLGRQIQALRKYSYYRRRQRATGP